MILFDNDVRTMHGVCALSRKQAGNGDPMSVAIQGLRRRLTPVHEETLNRNVLLLIDT